MAEEITNQQGEEGEKITVGLNKEKCDVTVKVTKSKKKVSNSEEDTAEPEA